MNESGLEEYELLHYQTYASVTDLFGEILDAIAETLCKILATRILSFGLTWEGLTSV